MGRDVPFDTAATCDICGVRGAYDFLGDFICQDCLVQAPNGSIDWDDVKTDLSD